MGINNEDIHIEESIDNEKKFNNGIEYNDDDEEEEEFHDGKPLLIKEPIISIGFSDKPKRKPLKQHKHLKEVVKIFILFSFLIMSTFLYQMFLPSVFQNYAKYKYPNATDNELQSKASFYKSFSDAFPQVTMFLFGPLFGGKLSDKFGRKPIICLAVVMFILDIISCYITIKTNNLICFYIFHTIGGIVSCGNSAFYAYISDISDEEHVSTLYSMAGIAMGVGVIFGPVIFAVTSTYETLPLFIAAGLLLCSLCILLFLKESIEIAKMENRIKPNSTSTSNPFKTIINLFVNKYMVFVMILYISMQYTSQDLISTFYYYTTLMYKWEPKYNGLFMGGLGAMIIIWGALIVPTLLKYSSERKIISIGFLIGIIGEICIIFSKHSQILFIFGGLFGCFVPNNINLMHALIVSAISDGNTGSVLTGLLSIGAIANFAGSIAANNIFSFSISSKSLIYFPQLLYTIDACIITLTFIGSILIWKFFKNQSNNKTNTIIN